MTDNLSRIARFNFWNGPLKSGYPRKVYIERLRKYQASNLIKVLVGQRRVGKSYLMRQVIQDLIDEGVSPKSTLYINMEFAEYNFIRDGGDLLGFVNNFFMGHEGPAYLFVDEIQNIPAWEKAINSLAQDFTRQLFVYITGSNAQLLSSELATFLSGRYIKFMVLPFSFAEYAGIRGEQRDKPTFLAYLNSGGLPELFHLEDEEAKRQYLSAIYDTVILRDIVQRHQIRDIDLLKDIVAFLANNISNLVSIPNLVNYFTSQKRKTNYETVAQYLIYLEQAYIIHRCERYNIKGKEIVSGNAKFYLNDLSFKNYLYRGFEHGMGYLLENAVYLQLRFMEYDVYVGQLRNGEIDFVAMLSDERLYVQSVWSLLSEQTTEREYKSLLSLRDNYRKLVVTADDIALPNNEGVEHQLVWNDWASPRS